MPIYEYRCESCGKELEKIQKISDPVLKDCPQCGKSALVKLISASSFRLMGSGWYETDFKTGTKKHGVSDSKNEESAANKSEASTKSDSNNKSDSSSKSEPAAKNGAGPSKKSKSSTNTG